MNANGRSLLVLIMVFASTAWGFQRVAPPVGAGAGSLVTFNKILVSFKPILSSEAGQRFVQGRTYVGKDAIQRIIFNADGSLFFGYDFVIEAVPNSSQFLVTVKALSPESLQKFQPGVYGGGGSAGVVAGARSGGGGRGVGGGVMMRGASAAEAGAGAIPVQPAVTLSPTQNPVSQRVSDGDTLSMDLLANPETGGKISDIIKVASTHRVMMRNAASADARANVSAAVPDTTNIWAFGFDVTVDGKLTATVGTGGCTGKLVYFSLKPQQRFIMSTQPYDGYDFSAAGMIDGNSIRFEWDGSTYELLSSEPVLEGGARAPLFLLVDTGPETSDAYLKEIEVLRAKLDSLANARGGADTGAGVRGRGGAASGAGGAGGRGVAGGAAAGPVSGTSLAVRLLSLVSCGASDQIESLVPKK